MSWNEILGHDSQLERLRKSAEGGRLAHAYAFVGPSGVGKRRFAFELAACLLCENHADADLEACGECASCRQVAAGTHPDLFAVSLIQGKRELVIKQFIGEDETRGKEGLCYDISLKPMSGRRRVAIIDDAEALNDVSANALLKTLEEPPPHSVLILIATSADLLLSTIRSRCQSVAFQPLSTAHVRQLLVREGVTDDEGEAAQAAGLCGGTLDAARQLLDPALRSLREDLYDRLAERPFRSQQTASRMVECLEPAGTQKASQREYAGWIIRYCLEFFRQSLLAVAGDRAGPKVEVPQVRKFVESLGEPTVETIDRVAELVERCLAADYQLEANATVALCLEALFDDVGRTFRMT
jgi:DNA polymerase-3 subunit delta'